MKGGEIVQYLRRNHFLVALHSGQVVAFVLEQLLPIETLSKELAPGEFTRVRARHFPPSRMARIEQVYRCALYG